MRMPEVSLVARAPAAAEPDDALAAATVETVADLVFVTDEFGLLRCANAAAGSLLGDDPTALQGTSLFDLIHPEEIEDVINALATASASSALHAVPVELRLRIADGSWRRVEVTVTNLVAHPQVQGIVFRCRDVSYRKDAERRFRLMFEQSPVAQALVAPGTRGVIANVAFARLFATSREALRTTAPESLVHPDDRAQMLQDKARLERDLTGRYVTERRYVRGDGETFVGRVAAALLRDPDGRFEYLSITIEDVSEELRAAEALNLSEARARALIDNSPDIIAVLYPDGEWEASDQGTRLLGYPKGFDPPGGVLSLVHPDDVPAAATALADILAGTRASDAPIELRLRAADGTYRQFECVGQNLAEAAHIGGVVVTARDITARKNAEARLRAAEQRFRVAFDHAPLVVSILDLDGRIVDINPAGCAMLGRSRDDLLGTLAELSVHPEDREQAIERTTAQLDGASAPVEFRLLSVGGQTISVLSHASLVEGSGGEAPYIITLQTDISDRKHLEAELERRATHDELTGLQNRASLDQHLEHALLRRATVPVAAIFVDLDDFKSVNDTFGHDAGDKLLAHVADRIRQSLRAGDVAARVGGDEFVVACDVTGAQQAFDIGERLRLAIQDGFHYADRALGVTASVGIAVSRPGENAASLVRQADTATYVAKRAGKARTELYARSRDVLTSGERGSTERVPVASGSMPAGIAEDEAGVAEW
jgi:diguanylate cyclase (GGDEF)-like protein/PAS domain S-box-containing protein